MSRWLMIIAIMTMVTVLTRVAPFLFFARRPPPAFLTYLQRYAPPMVMTILVLAAFKDIEFGKPPHGQPALAGAVLTAVLHFWRRNTLLSIVGGTGLYMLLSRLA